MKSVGLTDGQLARIKTILCVSSHTKVKTMAHTRTIREEEIALIHHLLELAGIDSAAHSIPATVHPYENDVMGSISLQLTDTPDYGGDFIQVRYIDTDQIPVIISLTHDQSGALLDLDFWKEDFSKLLRYPKPGEVELV